MGQLKLNKPALIDSNIDLITYFIEGTKVSVHEEFDRPKALKTNFAYVCICGQNPIYRLLNQTFLTAVILHALICFLIKFHLHLIGLLTFTLPSSARVYFWRVSASSSFLADSSSQASKAFWSQFIWLFKSSRRCVFLKMLF